jgi:3-oxoacyl-[acyl-carrier-protein] synthase I
MNLSVTASGMVTPVGFNYASSCAAMRAGISGIRQANLWDAESGEYLSAGKVDLPHWWEGLEKLADLAAPAILECLATAGARQDEIPILLGVAGPDRPCRLDGLDDELLDEVEYRLKLPHHPLSRTIARSNVSGAVGLQEAERILESGLAPACIVAGVDSFLQQSVVEAYLEQRRIMTPVNSNGFFPGEAGCAVLVERSTATKPELRVLGIGKAREDATIDSDKPFRGEGMTQAVREALSEAGLTIHETSYRITDLTGEHYKFKEAAFIAGRFFRVPLPALHDLWHPAEFLGEIGAAHIPCALGLALHGGRKRYTNGPRSLMHFGDGEDRASLVTEYVGAS